VAQMGGSKRQAVVRRSTAAAERGGHGEAVVGRERDGGGLGPGAEEEWVVHVRGIEWKFTGGGGLWWRAERREEEEAAGALGFGPGEENGRILMGREEGERAVAGK
jgi:hypothetical protein